MRDKKIKCVVWDLDDTLWEGTLLEGDDVRPGPAVPQTIRTLDERGILQSVASKNDHAHAWSRLQALGLAEYFLLPQIHWGPKSDSLARLASELNLGIDTFAFIDDQDFELEEVRFSHPDVLCLHASALPGLLELPAMMPRFVTDDARQRRAMMRADLQRQDAESSFAGAREDFLATLGLELSIAPAREDDLRRAEELTLRTSQLNTTGETYSCDELHALAQSPRHLLLIAGLRDRFGSYGKIGLVLVDKQPGAWSIRLLLMSCRVMSRGVGAILINHLRDLARAAGVRLLAEFVPTDRNRMMYVTYKFNHFREAGGTPERLLLENDLSTVQHAPDYVRVHAHVL